MSMHNINFANVHITSTAIHDASKTSLSSGVAEAAIKVHCTKRNTMPSSQQHMLI